MNTKKTLVMLSCLVAIMFTSGCTNWKKKYNSLNVEHQNLRGLYDREKAEKGQLAGEVSQGRQTIQELQRKIAELNQTPGQATGFGDGYDVTIDAAAGTVTVTLPNSILFSSGRATLKKTSSTELNHIQSVLQSQYGSRMIDIVGHTDSDPIRKSKWKDNWELSAQRSLAVLRYLIGRGVPKDQIRAVGRGSSQPIASNATSSGKATNRRVEIVVHLR